METPFSFQEEREGPGTSRGADYLRCEKCSFLDRALFIGYRFRATGRACRKCGNCRTVDNFKMVSQEEWDRIAKGEYDYYQQTDHPNVSVEQMGDAR